MSYGHFNKQEVPTQTLEPNITMQGESKQCSYASSSYFFA